MAAATRHGLLQSPWTKSQESHGVGSGVAWVNLSAPWADCNFAAPKSC